MWVKDANGTIVGANVLYTGSAQNPYLEPVTADQADVSLEWYFDEVGYAAFAVFYKQFDDYIQFGTFNREVTNNGVTEVVEVRGPLNGEGAEIRGFEVSFQRFFDFLPAPFDGLGVQANYTYIDNKGITNTNVTEVGGRLDHHRSGAGRGPGRQARGSVGQLVHRHRHVREGSHRGPDRLQLAVRVPADGHRLLRGLPDLDR